VDIDGIAHVCDVLNLRCGRQRETAGRGPQVSIACPLAPWTHKDDTDHNMSCSVSLDEDGPSYVRCFSWNCDFKGSFLFLIQRVINKTVKPELYADLLKYVQLHDKDDIESRARRAVALIDSGQTDAKSALARSRNPVSVIHHDEDILPEDRLALFAGKVPRYILGRGLTIETCKAWEIGYDEDSQRAVFPVRRRDGSLVGMTGRILPREIARCEAMGLMEPTKYHNYSGLNKTRYLYGANLWLPGLPLIVVEGPVDAHATWQALSDRANVCATLGQGFTQAHRRMIRNFQPPSVYIFGDSDSAGQRMSEKIESVLHRDVPMFLMRCPTSTAWVYNEDVDDEIEQVVELDPGGCSGEQLNHAFDTADPILDGIVW
jgi:5S rRNA maturation endonuclease (ribonuclease M5)